MSTINTVYKEKNKIQTVKMARKQCKERLQSDFHGEKIKGEAL